MQPVMTENIYLPLYQKHRETLSNNHISQSPFNVNLKCQLNRDYLVISRMIRPHSLPD